ncbi:MAG: CocE/NonD family hydrolase [Actinomycetia bacterium]|jgi:putative CocE/NonD family hydrolase|nr:CocE/NonD family hydrolase [Actinomycetes bacterium]
MRTTVEKGVVVPMRDGVDLVADVHLPEGRGPFPALLQRVPYSREAGRIVDFSLDSRRALKAGYAVVVQDVRGRFASGGAFTPFLDDANDGAETVAWTAAQPWCDGRVGMAGGSYGGAVQWAAARMRPPALSAIAPFVATNDCYDGWIYRDGVFELGFNLHWALRNIAPPAAARQRSDRLEQAIGANDRIDELYRRVPLLDQPDLDDLAPFYGDWLREPVPNGRWGGLRPAGPAAVDLPTLSIGGWYDIFQMGTLAGHASLAGSAAPRRLVMGPWAHSVFGGTFAERSFGIGADSAVVDLTGLHLRWYDRWVKGEQNGAEHDAPVRLFVMGADYWRDEPDWPLPDTDYTEYFLHSGGKANGAAGDGTLSTRPPRDEPADTYDYDPRTPVPTVGGTTFLPGLHVAANAGPRDQHPAESRSDVLCFTSAPLDAAVEATGPVAAILTVSSSAPDADFVVTLADVTPEGRSTNVTSGVARARYRSSRTAPSLLEPGRSYEIAVDLGGCSHVFRRGHRIRLQVTSGSFPRFERNPQTGGLPAEDAELRPARHTVYHDAKRASRIVLPVVERDETLARLA